MITELNIKGFKCFDEEQFSLAPLTLLAGLNSSGKSSLLQAVRLVTGCAPLAGHGPMKELVSKLGSSFAITAKTDAATEHHCAYPETVHPGSGFVPGPISYIGASRLGPETHLPLNRDRSDIYSVGSKGEYTLDFLERHKELAGLPDLLRRAEASSFAVRTNVSAWLNIISPGVELAWEAMDKADLVRAEYSGRRPTNVGFGLSYTLPVIATVLVYAALRQQGTPELASPLILLENPEAHLHPAGQTQLGLFLARGAACGVQIVVETHSDHLLNGIRLAVKEGLLAHTQAAFYFFSYDFDAEHSTVERPLLDRHGYFDHWPDGFFDETEKTLEKLL